MGKYKKRLKFGEEQTRERIRELKQEMDRVKGDDELVIWYRIGIHYLQVTLLAFGLEMEK